MISYAMKVRRGGRVTMPQRPSFANPRMDVRLLRNFAIIAHMREKHFRHCGFA